MLDLFRRKKRGLKWTLWLVILTLSGGMVLLFVDTPTGVGVSLGNRDVAIVAGSRITVTEYRKHYNRLIDTYQRLYNISERDPSILKQLGLGKQALDQLVNLYVIGYEAQRLGLQVTPEEIFERISSYPVFLENGKFIGPDRYKQVLAANNLSPAEFEDSIRLEIMQDKLRRILTDGIRVTGEEVREEFVERNQKVKVQYVLIDPEKFVPGDIQAEELKAYFEEHKDNYKTPEKRKIKYVSIPLKLDEIQLSDEDIQNRMASIPEKQRVRASHILVRIEDPEKEEQAHQEAQEILQKLSHGADFAELAGKHSDDPGSAERGGDLGSFERGAMVPEFEQVAFSLEPGQISDLVRTFYGFHIIQVTEVEKADRRALAEAALRREEAQKTAHNLATKFAYETRRESNFDTVAQRYQLEVKETPFFAVGDVIPGLKMRSDFNQQIFTLGRSQVSDPYETRDSYVVAQLADIQPPEVPEFETVKDRVLGDVKAGRAEEKAREKAFEFYQSARESRFQSAAQKHGLKATTTDFFGRSASIDERLGAAQEVLNRAFRMKEEEVSPPVTASGKYVVFRLEDKSPIDEKKFEQETAEIGRQLTEQKRSRFFSAWIQNTVERLYQEKLIEVNRELLDAVAS